MVGNYDINDKLCPELALSWENKFTLLGFQIDNRLKDLNNNYEKFFKKFMRLAEDGQDTYFYYKAASQLLRPFFYPNSHTQRQYWTLAPVPDPSASTYDTINRMLRSFVNTGSTLILGKVNWINQEDILYDSNQEDISCDSK